jgi:hypothetical protein
MVSGGAWTAGTRQGVYRLIVSNYGSKHVVSTARVEWVVTPARDAVPSTIATAALPIAAQQYSLGAPDLYANFEGWNAQIGGIQVNDRSQRCWRIWLGAPGALRQVADR